MVNNVSHRLISAVVMSALFCLVTITLQIVQQSYYQNISIVEYLDASFTAENVILEESRSVRTNFIRNAPFDLPTKQTTEIRAFCNGDSILLRQRPAISITLNSGFSEIPVSYNLDDWGFEKVEQIYKDCDFVVSKTWDSIELPNGVKRSLQLKATFKVL